MKWNGLQQACPAVVNFLYGYITPSCSKSVCSNMHIPVDYSSFFHPPPGQTRLPMLTDLTNDQSKLTWSYPTNIWSEMTLAAYQQPSKSRCKVYVFLSCKVFMAYHQSLSMYESLCLLHVYTGFERRHISCCKGFFWVCEIDKRVENCQHYLLPRVDRISVLFNLKTKQRKLFSFHANYKLFGKLSNSQLSYKLQLKLYVICFQPWELSSLLSLLAVVNYN